MGTCLSDYVQSALDQSLLFGLVAPRCSFKVMPDSMSVFVPRHTRPHSVPVRPIWSEYKLEMSKDISEYVNHVFGTSDKQGERSGSSLRRAARAVRELLCCNKFDYFITCTVDANKLDRYDLGALIKEFSTRVKNLNRRRSKPIQYVVVPERHKDGAWHLHGVIRGLKPQDIRRNENGYPELIFAREHIGFTSMSKIRDQKRTATYVSKYISKSFGTDCKGVRLYYASKGLKRARRGTLLTNEQFFITEATCTAMGADSYSFEYGSVFTFIKHTDAYKQFMRQYARVMRFKNPRVKRTA